MSLVVVFLAAAAPPVIGVLLVAIALGLLMPLLNAFVVKANASPHLKTLVAVLIAGGGAVLARITETGGVTTITELLTVAALAIPIAGGARVSLLANAEQTILNHVPGGIGKDLLADVDHPPYGSSGGKASPGQGITP